MMFGDAPAFIDCDLGYACQFCDQEDVCALNKPHHNKVLLENRLAEIGQILVVLANKGGVGKSTISANLAAGLAARRFHVGIADADIHGPNQSRFFGHAGAHTRVGDQGLKPLEYDGAELAHPVKIGSLAFLMEDDTTPIVWRDAYKHDFIHHLIGSFAWGSLDYLVVDMPPGTGNELITLCDLLEGCNTAAIVVTTPQAVAQMDSLKAARYCQERGLPVVGAVENMAGVVCPLCNGKFHIFPNASLDKALADMDIPRIASIPLAPELAMGSDSGEPVVATAPDSEVAKAFAPLLDACIEVGREAFEASVAGALPDVFAENLAAPDVSTALQGLPEGEAAEINAQIAELLDGESERLRQSATSTPED